MVWNGGMEDVWVCLSGICTSDWGWLHASVKSIKCVKCFNQGADTRLQVLRAEEEVQYTFLKSKS